MKSIHRWKGQTLTEYSLAAGLIALVAVMGLLAFSGSLQTMLPDLLDRIFDDGNSSPPSFSPRTGTYQTFSMTPVSDASLPEAMTSVCSADQSTCFNLPEVYTATVDETAGALGEEAALRLAWFLSQMEMMEESGEITDLLEEMVTALSDTGHHIGDNLAEMEQGCTQAGLSGAQCDVYYKQELYKASQNPQVTEDLTSYILTKVAVDAYMAHNTTSGMSDMEKDIVRLESDRVLGILDRVIIQPLEDGRVVTTDDMGNSAIQAHVSSNETCSAGGDIRQCYR